MKSIYLILLPALLPIYAVCQDLPGDRKAQLVTELHSIESDRSQVSQDLNARRRQQDILQQRMQDLEETVAAYRGQVWSYIQDHKSAVAALAVGVAGAQVAIDPDNAFSEQVREIGGVSAAMAIVYMIDNYAEVAEVAATLLKADGVIKSLQAEILNTDNRISQLANPISDLQQSISELDQSYSNVRYEYETLR